MKAAGEGSTKVWRWLGPHQTGIVGVNSQEMKSEFGKWKELMEAVKEEAGQEGAGC